MKQLTVMVGFAFISVALTPLGGGAQERVPPFDRLTSPRITLPDDHRGAISHRHMCPESNDTCRTYRAYTGDFVRNATIPPRERELLILRTAWLSRGDYIWGRHNVMGQDAGLHRSGDQPNHRGSPRGRVERPRGGAAESGRRAPHEPVRVRRDVEHARPAILRESAEGGRVDRRQLHAALDVSQHARRPAGVGRRRTAGRGPLKPSR